MKFLNIFSIILSIIALIGSAYSYKKTCAAIRKIDDLDDAVFQYMKDEHNESYYSRHEEAEDVDSARELRSTNP